MAWETGYVLPPASSWTKMVWADAAEAAARRERTFMALIAGERLAGG